MHRLLLDRWPLLAAIATVVVWLSLLNTLKPIPIADERMHYPVVEGIVHGHWPPPGYLGMPAAYHGLLAAVLSPFTPTLAAARTATAAISILLLILVDLAARHRWHAGGRFTALLWAWNPVFLPFSALVYTDPLALAAIAAAILAFARRRPLGGYFSLTLATFVRQSSLIWMIVPWLHAEWSARSAHPSELDRRDELRRHRIGPVAGVAIALAGLSWLGGVEQGGAGANAVRFNIAQFYVFAAIFGLVVLPLWFAQLWTDAETVLQRISRAKWTTLAVALAGLGLALFDNPHPFNNDSDYLRNHLLMAMVRSPLILTSVVVFDLLACLGIALFVARRRNRAELAAIFACSAAYLAMHWLVDPRYYLPIMLWFVLAVDWEGRRAWAALGWSAALSIAACAYVLARGGAGVGVW